MRTNMTARVIGFLAAVLAFPAWATFHEMDVAEVFPGTAASPNAQYVVIQMYAPGQNLVGGHALTVFNASGTLVSTFTFPANVGNGANQAKILIATTEAQSFFGLSADLTMSAALLSAGGEVCWAGTIDCVAWGAYTGSATGVGTPYLATSGLKSGKAAKRRLDIAGSASVLDAGDDTNNSANDFIEGLPAPRNNANVDGTIPAATCGNGVIEGLEECDDHNLVDGDGCSSTCTITPVLPTLSIADVAIVEGNTATKTVTFTVNLSQTSASDVSFDIATADGSATSGSDYVASSLSGQSISAGQTSKTFSVTINGDTTIEPNETFFVNLSNASGALIADSHAVGTITNDDFPSLSINNASVTEGNSGTKTLTFTVSLSAAASTAVTYNIATANNTATAGSDYVASSLTGQSIPAGVTSKTFSVTINGDTTIEPNETFFANVSNVVGATVADPIGVGTISNDDFPSLSINNVALAEGNSGTKVMTFSVTLSQAAATAVTYNIATANNAATAGSDYVAVPLIAQSIPAGVTSKTFSVTINGDTTIEPNETFFVNVSSVNGATVADPTGVGTISNDDFPALSINNASVAEGNSGTKILTFTVSLSAAANNAVTYNVSTVNNTATAGSDYVALPVTAQSIPAGTTSKTVSVTLNGDTTIEPNETFFVNVSSVNGATVADPTGVGTISNDDFPSLSINNASLSEGNSGTQTMTFTVSLSAPASNVVNFNVSTANNTATAGSDYLAVPVTAQSIPAGTTSKPISVTINGDTAIEPNETFFINVSSVNGATVADPTGVGTIVNDDGAALRIASISTGGLVDDIDDGNRAPVLSLHDYTLLLHDTAQRICQRAGAATIVAVDDVENRAVLNDLADATNLSCGTQPYYAAVMAPGDSRGFLIAAPTTTDKDGLRVLGRPETFSDAHATALSVLPPGQSRPITILLASAPEGTLPMGSAQAQALARRVQQRVAQNPTENVIVFGARAVPDLVDLTLRAPPLVNLPKFTLPKDRILVSPALLRQFRGSHVEFLPMPKTDELEQYLQLQQ
jgi:cysteine-rich repeat protein